VFTDPLIGKQLGDYRIINLLGRGGMARVYRGYDPALDRFAAVKVIDAHLMSTSADEYRQRFQREARAIAHLHHPNIVSIYQFGEIDSLYYMAMVFVEGRDLGEILEEHENTGTLLEPVQVLRIVHDIAGALDYAHAGGVIHRDVKPSNVMVATDGHAVLTDFGLALSVPEGSLGNTFGSAHYIAPEQAVSSAQAVPQSDMYALGVVLYQMLTGRVPFDDESAMSVALKHIGEPPPPPRLFNPALSPAVENVLLKALEKDPYDRYPNGEALARALEMALGISPLGTNVALPSARRPSRPDQPEQSVDEGLRTLIFPPSQPGLSELRSSILTRPEDAPKSPLIRLLAVLAAFLALGLVIAGVAIAIGALSVSAPPAQANTPTASPATTAPTRTEPDPAPTAAPTSANLAVIVLPASPTPLSSASAAPTETVLEATPLRTPTPFLTNGEQAVYLMFDGETLTLMNGTEQFVDVSGLVFAQVGGGGSEVSFRSDHWSGGTRPPAALPPGDCFQVWTNRYSEWPMPEVCKTRHAWRAVAPSRWFWISDQPETVFEVRRGGEVLTTCFVADGFCAINLGS